jgi:hypothetical protein
MHVATVPQRTPHTVAHIYRLRARYRPLRVIKLYSWVMYQILSQTFFTNTSKPRVCKYRAAVGAWQHTMVTLPMSNCLPPNHRPYKQSKQSRCVCGARPWRRSLILTPSCGSLGYRTTSYICLHIWTSRLLSIVMMATALVAGLPSDESTVLACRIW